MRDIDNYDEFRHHINKFKSQASDLLIIEGSHGTGKTHHVKEQMKGTDHAFITGNLTAYQLHRKLYEHRDEPVVIDDIETLLGSSSMKSLLKQCGQHDQKTLQYHSERLDPQVEEFTTSSNLCVIANEFKGRRGMNRKAVESRGDYINFQPRPDELLNQMADIAAKNKGGEPVLNYLHQLKDIILTKNTDAWNLRTLVLSINDYQYHQDHTAPYDWQAEVAKRCGINTCPAWQVAKLQTTSDNPIKDFTTRTGMTERTYRRYQNKLNNPEGWK